LISKIPQLRHLKLVSYGKMFQSVADIYQWEKFIRTELNFLDTCEFLVSYEMSSDDVVSLPSLLAPFQEPFWVHEKRWFIVCEYELGFSTIFLHTIPMDIKTLYHYSWKNGSLCKSSRTNSHRILYKDNIYHFIKGSKEEFIDVSNYFKKILIEFNSKHDTSLLRVALESESLIEKIAIRLSIRWFSLLPKDPLRTEKIESEIPNVRSPFGHSSTYLMRYFHDLMFF